MRVSSAVFSLICPEYVPALDGSFEFGQDNLHQGQSRALWASLVSLYPQTADKVALGSALLAAQFGFPSWWPSIPEGAR